MEARIANGSEGESEPYRMGRIVRVPEIEKFDRTATEDAAAEFSASLVGQNLETIEKVGWSADEQQPVNGLPLPLPGEGAKQELQIRLPAPPVKHALLYVWLRGEPRPRATRVRP